MERKLNPSSRVLGYPSLLAKASTLIVISSEIEDHD